MKPNLCEGCPLHQVGDGYAYGEGPEDAQVLLLGEALGAQEAFSGRPFVGGAGRLLNKILYKSGVLRSTLHITNVVRCRPPGNRTPTEIEMRECTKRHRLKEFMQQFHLIVPMGNAALLAVTGKHGIMKWRGSVFLTDDGLKVLPTLHPAAIMRQESMLPASISDFERVTRERTTKKLTAIEQKYTLDAHALDVDRVREEGEPFAFDVETDRGPPRLGSISLLGLSNEPGGAFVFHDLRGPNLKAKLQDLFATKLVKIGHNVGFDIGHVEAHGIKVAKPWFDTMIAHHLILSDVPNDLGFVSSLYTDIPYWKDMSRAHPRWYNATDADATLRIYYALEGRLKQNNMMRIFDTTMNTIPAVEEMEAVGVRVNTGQQIKWKIALERRICYYQQELIQLVGDKYFNWKSPQQVMTLLYDQMGFPPQYKRGTRKRTADEDALEALYIIAPSKAVRLLLTLRKLGKLSSTYFTPVDTPDGRAHSSYLLHGTGTGRLASRDPNLQNVPQGPARNIYIPDDGKMFLSADYSQIEMRIQAILAKEESQLKAFAAGEDIHKRNAALLYSKLVIDVTKKERKTTKDLTFGLNYGKGVRSLAIDLGVTVGEARRLTEEYFRQLPNVKRWRQDLLQEVATKGYLTNSFGRRRYFFAGIDAPKVYNFKPQSTAADILLEALAALYTELPKDTRLVLTVHDQVLVEFPEGSEKITTECVKDVMERPIDVLDGYVVPIDIKVGKTWGECD